LEYHFINQMTQEQQRYLDVKFIYGRKDDRSTAGLRLFHTHLRAGADPGGSAPARAP
jgi:hypothetical protein